jgi:hypothetical protein
MATTSATTHSPVWRPAAGSARWLASNDALARWLATRRRSLRGAAATAAAIRRGIDRLSPQMAALCARTCHFCPEPCCITNTVWFDFRDLLYLHLTAAPIPPHQAASDPGQPCPFLAHRGCRLPPPIRPWMCIAYICPAQGRRMQRTAAVLRADFERRIARIDRQRLAMEAALMQALRRSKRTSPSSFPACGG